MLLQKVVGLEIHVWQVRAPRVPPFKPHLKILHLKGTPLAKGKHSLCWGGFGVCFPCTDFSRAVSPATFLEEKLSAGKLWALISHGVISIRLDLFVCCLPVLVSAQWTTAHPSMCTQESCPRGLRDAAELCRSHQHLPGHSHT